MGGLLGGLTHLFDGIGAALDPVLLLYCAVGVALGTLGGVLPGLGITGTMALALPYIFTLDPLPALIVLGGITYGANFGNSTSAILLNIPGDPGALATMIDGHKLAMNGRAGPALVVAAVSSFAAALVGTLGIALLSPMLAPLAIKFGPPEFFGLLVFALVLVSTISSGPLVKSLLMLLFGLVLTLPGADPIEGTSRFTFGIDALLDGLHIVPVAMGLFAFGEVLYGIRPRRTQALVPKLGKLMPTRTELRRMAGPISRGSVLGFFVGILPGAGSTPAAFAAYGLEKRLGRRDRPGTGSLAGVAAPESANNAAAAGAFVPLMSLGIPGSAPLALVLGTLTVLGARPGPRFMTEQPELFWGMVGALLLGSLLLLILNLPMIGLWARVLTIPYPLLVTLIFVVTVAGVFSVQNSLADVWIALGLGAVGIVLRHYEFPFAPALLGFVLGSDLEQSFRSSLVLSDGSWTVFVTSPFAAIMLALAAALLVLPSVRRYVGRRARTRP